MAARSSDWPQWRGPHRDAQSKETGLAKEWPASGPKLAWAAEDAGGGYSTPIIVGDRLYFITNEGVENESLQARSTADGKILWTTRLGAVGNPDQKPPYPGSRSTPTVDGDRIYALSSDGDLVAADRSTGKEIWRRQLRQGFGGKPGIWAYAESPLIDGDLLICTPGGTDATVLALRKSNGEVAWKAALPEGDEAGYASVIAVEAAGRRQYVQLLQKGLVGLDAKTGALLWRWTKPVSRFNANIPTPLGADGVIYVGSAGTGGGAVKIVPKDAGVGVEELYFESKLPTTIGGVVKVGEHLYGTTGTSMVCVEFATGNMKWEERVFGPSSLMVADGRIYVHAESGEVALVEPSPEGFRLKGKFTPPGLPARVNAMEKAWAHPVVAGGRLYIRDLNRLYCYDVKG